MPRKKPTSVMYERLLSKNANSCCVCKRNGVGLNLHHIDGDNSNTTDDNLAVLCVQEHDAHHRPAQNKALNHLDLSSERLLLYKHEWEDFVSECSKDTPRVIATISVFGTMDFLHAMKLIFQWDNGSIVFERTYHAIEMPMILWIDKALEEVSRFGKNIKIVFIDEPLDIEYCENCIHGISHTIDEVGMKRFTADDWKELSIATVYIYPDLPRVSISIFYNHTLLYSINAHKCNDILHIEDSKKDYFTDFSATQARVKQVKNIILGILKSWDAGKTFIGTGDDNNPTILDTIEIPEILWN